MKCCPYCNSNRVRKSGKLPSGKQRYYCDTCHKYHSEGTPIKKIKHGVCPHCGGPTRKSGYNRSGSQRWLCLECGKKSSGETTLIYFRHKHSEIECPHCHSHIIKKAGHLADGTQRYECHSCKKFFSSKTVIKKDLGKVCPTCGSHKIGTAGKDRDGAIRYRCLDCKRRFKENIKPRVYDKYQIVCPSCGHKWAKKSGHSGSGKQYYKCLNCGHKYLENPKYHQLTKSDIEKIYLLYLDGLCKLDIARETHRSNRTIHTVLKNIPKELEFKRIALKERKMLAQKGINIPQDILREIKLKILNGISLNKILEDYELKQNVVNQLEDIYTSSEILTEFQKDLIVKFGIGCGVPIDYLAPYIPCSQKACKKVLSKFKPLKRPKIEVSEKDKNFDKLLLDRFLA